MHDLHAEYQALCDDEANAEHQAHSITDRVREKFHIDADGKMTDYPIGADCDQEAEAWANVAALRAKRVNWVREHVRAATMADVVDEPEESGPPRTPMSAVGIVASIREYIEVVPYLEHVQMEVVRLAAPDTDGANWALKHSPLPEGCPGETARLFYEVIQQSRDAFSLVDVLS